MTQSPQTNAKGFSKAFWVSNTVELFERMAYYAVFYCSYHLSVQHFRF